MSIDINKQQVKIGFNDLFIAFLYGFKLFGLIAA